MAVARGHRVQETRSSTGSRRARRRAPPAGRGQLRVAPAGARSQVDRTRQRRLSARAGPSPTSTSGRLRTWSASAPPGTSSVGCSTSSTPSWGSGARGGCRSGHHHPQAPRRYPDLWIVALEPAENLLRPGLRRRPGAAGDRPSTTLAEFQPGPDERFDAVVYINVLEHIDDDAGELRLAARALTQAGRCSCSGPRSGGCTASWTTRPATTAATACAGCGSSPATPGWSPVRPLLRPARGRALRPGLPAPPPRRHHRLDAVGLRPGRGPGESLAAAPAAPPRWARTSS